MGPHRLLLLLAVALTTACGSEQAGGSADIEGDWTLVSSDAVSVPPRHPTTLSIEGDRISGRAACNQYGGTARIDGDRIELSALSMTEIACEEQAMAAEAAFMQTLGEVDRARRAGRRLILTGPNDELRFDPVEPTPTARLADSPWMLDTLIADGAASTTVGNAILRFGSDGALTGSTGCRDFTGSYVRRGGEIRTTRLTMASNIAGCSTAAAQQDEIVVAVIGGSFTAQVEGDRLTLTSGRYGLVYRLS